MTVEPVDVEDLILLADFLGAGPALDVGALDGAAARSRSRVMGVDSYPTLELKAAALMHSICRTGGLGEDNGRLAVSAGMLFLRINGSKLGPTQDEAVELALGLSDGRIDVAQAAEVLTN